MTFIIYIHFAAALMSLCLVIYSLSRDVRSFAHRIFAVGMLILGLETLFAGFSIRSLLLDDLIFWERMRFGVSALLPVSWLLFSLSFARIDYRSILSKWKWVLGAVLLLHLSFVGLFAPDFYREISYYETSSSWLLHLGWSGKAFHICFLISTVLITIVLENVLRASSGQKRRRIKFLVLGIGAILVARVYTVSQVLLFSTINLQLEAINAAAILVAGLLIIISMLRSRINNFDIYPSQIVLHNSITAMAAGVYFLAVALSAKAIHQLGGPFSFLLNSFLVLLALLASVAVLLSDRLRQKSKGFISRHFRRPRYDYREVWMGFTQRTAPLLEIRDLCEAVIKLISEKLDLLSVSIWLTDQTQKDLNLGASTVFSEIHIRSFPDLDKAGSGLIRLMREEDRIFDFQASNRSVSAMLSQYLSEFVRVFSVRYCVPLVTGDDLVGLMTLGDRVGGKPLTPEELDLMKTMASQLAGKLMNIRLSEHLRHAKEMEAFQTVAAFFVHDLKNLASKLSMTLQNLSTHFNNPEFREDASNMLSHSVAKINTMCSRLGMLTNGLILKPVQTNFNDLIRTTLEEFDGVLKASVLEDLHPLPMLALDPEQIRKVLTNLVLNANDAVEEGGRIHICTGRRDGWVELIVADNGCGISKEFMEKCLLRPFKTTKQHGTGIGLFQSKLIVEAHKGRIEVESEEGVGSTFRVLLPIKQETPK